MAVTRAQKAEALKELKEQMKRSSSVIFAHYIGLTVSDISKLRGNLKKNNAEMKVAKKTLMRLAAKDLGMPDVHDDQLDGPVACIFSYEDPLQGAQVAYAFAKDHPQVQLIGGIYDGQVLSKASALELARMPNRNTLLAMFMSMVQSPLSSFASMCTSPLQGFARIADELAKKGGIPAKA